MLTFGDAWPTHSGEDGTSEGVDRLNEVSVRFYQWPASEATTKGRKALAGEVVRTAKGQLGYPTHLHPSGWMLDGMATK